MEERQGIHTMSKLFRPNVLRAGVITCVAATALSLSACSGSGSTHRSHGASTATPTGTGTEGTAGTGGSGGSSGGTGTGGNTGSSGTGGTGSSGGTGSTGGSGSTGGTGGGSDTTVVPVTLAGAIGTGVGSALGAVGTAVANTGEQLPNQTLLGGANPTTTGLSSVAVDVGNGVTGVGKGVSAGIGQAGNVANPVSITLDSAGHLVNATGHAVNDLGQTVTTVGAFQGSPILPITAALGANVSGIGQRTDAFGNVIDAFIISGYVNGLTQPLSNIYTTVAVLGQRSAGQYGSTNLVADISTLVGNGSLDGGVLVAVVGNGIASKSIPGLGNATTAALGGTVISLGGAVITTGAGITAGLGQTGAIANPVGVTTGGVAAGVSGAGATVNGVSQTVASLGGANPLASVTAPVSTLVAQVGAGVTTVGGTLTAANNGPLQPVTQALSNVVNGVHGKQ